MRRVLLAGMLSIATLMAGCAVEDGLAGAKALTAGNPPATGAVRCPAGSFLTAIDADGGARCERPVAAFQCPSGEFVHGFEGDGTPRCSAPAAAAPAPQPVSSNLKVTGVYGYRNDTTTSEVHKLKVLTELSAGATPLDMTQLVIRFSDGSTSYNFGYGWNDGKGFNATWIRGASGSAMMQAGDLVEIEFHTWPAVPDIATRTSIALSVVPEAASPIAIDFKTPPTYGTDKVITLR